MSPEQTRGRDLSPATDVFSLGIVLYEMLTGWNPFEKDSASETIAAILRDTPPLLRSLRGDAQEQIELLVGKCLEKDPSKRFADAKAFTLALARCQGVPSVPASPSSFPLPGSVDQSGTIPDEQLLRSRELLREGQRAFATSTQQGFREAESALRQAVEIDASLAEGHAALASTLHQLYYFGWGASHRDTLREALEHAQTATHLAPDLPAAHLAIVRMSWDLGKHELALSEGLAAVAAAPEERDALEALTCGYIYAGLPDHAIPYAERLVSRYPDDERSLHLLGDAHQGASNFEASNRAFKEHVARFPKVGTAYELLGINALNRGDVGAAVDWIRRGQSATGDVNWLILGEVLWLSDTRKDALRAWQEGVRVYEAQPEPRRPRGRVWLAMLYARLRFPEFARELLDLALADDPSNSYLEYRAACARGMLGDPPGAAALLRASREHGFRCVQLCRLEEPIYLRDLAGNTAYEHEISALEKQVRELAKAPPSSRSTA